MVVRARLASFNKEQEEAARDLGASDWQAFRESQREPAKEAVASALVLDEVARKEGLAVTEAEIEQEIGRYAERTGRTAAAVRATLEKEGEISRIYAGLRREKSVDYVMARATISGASDPPALVIP